MEMVSELVAVELEASEVQVLFKTQVELVVLVLAHLLLVLL